MLNKIKNIIYLSTFCVLIGLVVFYYFSDQNVKKTNKFRYLYTVEAKDDFKNLQILENDTENIIEYRNDVETFKKKKKKYKFWDLIKDI